MTQANFWLDVSCPDPIWHTVCTRQVLWQSLNAELHTQITCTRCMQECSEIMGVYLCTGQSATSIVPPYWAQFARSRSPSVVSNQPNHANGKHLCYRGNFDWPRPVYQHACLHTSLCFVCFATRFLTLPLETIPCSAEPPPRGKYF